MTLFVSILTRIGAAGVLIFLIWAMIKLLKEN